MEIDFEKFTNNRTDNVEIDSDFGISAEIYKLILKRNCENSYQNILNTVADLFKSKEVQIEFEKLIKY